MDTQIIVLIVVSAVGIISLGVFAYVFFQPKQQSDIRSLMAAHRDADAGLSREVRDRLKQDDTGKDYEELKEQTRKSVARKMVPSLEEQFFRAGIFTEKQKADFKRIQMVLPMVLVPIVLVFLLMFNDDPMSVGAGTLLAGYIGYRAPSFMLDGKIKRRNEDILYYLPLVIEQISIGVSSSLDIGPCLQRIVQMADERDTHNSVTELIRHSQYHIKSGSSLEESMQEVGHLSGHTELKHAFLALAQVARHGGEISKQLQELADSVTSQREAKVEGKIKRLELEATAPVALVFVGFFIILLVTFTTQLKGSL